MIPLRIFPIAATAVLLALVQAGSAAAEAPATTCCGLECEHPFAPPPEGAQGAYVQDNDITWQFHANVPEDSRAYILQLWQDIRLPLRKVLGAPSRNITVQIRWNPDQGAGGSYYHTSNEVTLKHLPQAPDDPSFNHVFTHETVHVFQDLALDQGSWVNWAVEGQAVCATELVTEQLRGIRAFISRWDLGVLTTHYDDAAQMESGALPGSPYFSSGVIHWDYAIAGGFWWMLTATQSTARSGDWAHHDYLRRFGEWLYSGNHPLNQTSVLEGIRATATMKIDGEDPGAWSERQPITVIDAPPGRFIWALPDGGSGLMFAVLRRYSRGGSRYPLNGATVTIKAWDTVNPDPIWTTQEPYSDGGFGWSYVSFPEQIRNNPGGYRLEVSSSGAHTISMTVIVPPWTGSSAGLGTGVVFFDVRTNRIVQPRIWLKGATLLESRPGLYLVRPDNLSENPSLFTISLASVDASSPRSRAVSAPLPYRRFLRINLGRPAPPQDDDPPPAYPNIVRANLSSEDLQDDRGAGDLSLSRDGRVVAFASDADLVPGDANNVTDIFVRDLEAGTTTRVSVAFDGGDPNDLSYSPSLSGDGRFVAFASWATNLVPDDTNDRVDIFVHDCQTRITTRASVSSEGVPANEFSYSPSISANGRSVAFISSATNLVRDDTNATMDVFVHDSETGSTSRVNISSEGDQANHLSWERPFLSADGNIVAFASLATNLVPDDTNSCADIFVHDRQTGLTSRANVSTEGAQASADSGEPSVSDDGLRVAFTSYANNLVPSDTNGGADVFVRDMQTGTTIRASVGNAGEEAEDYCSWPSLSGDGRYVAFQTPASNLVTGDGNWALDIFVRDLQAGTTVRVGQGLDGSDPDSMSYHACVSGDGGTVAFLSFAANLVPDDTNHATDAFVASR